MSWLKRLWDAIFNLPENPEDYICPVCGYYCLGHGGYGCIDKSSLQNEDTL